MLKQLPTQLDAALRIIANHQQIGLKINDINALVNQGYVTPKFGGGWKTTSKGRRYLKENNNKT